MPELKDTAIDSLELIIRLSAEVGRLKDKVGYQEAVINDKSNMIKDWGKYADKVDFVNTERLERSNSLRCKLSKSDQLIHPDTPNKEFVNKDIMINQIKAHITYGDNYYPKRPAAPNPNNPIGTSTLQFTASGNVGCGTVEINPRYTTS